MASSRFGSGSCSWVVEMEKMLADADRSVEMARWSKPSIYRVPEWLKEMAAGDVYRPHLVSLGPFHHGKPNLAPMEEHKRRAVLHIVRRSGRPLREFFAAVEEVADQLLDAYDGLDDEWRRGERRSSFVEMMVMDGCFLLEMIKGLSRKEAPQDYAPNDPVFSQHGLLFLWEGVRSDMLVIENQLPLLALYRLDQIWCDTAALSSGRDMNKLVLDFMWDPLREDGPKETMVEDVLSLHPLDVFHKNFCGLRPAPRGSGKWQRSLPCAVELKEAGVRFRRCDRCNPSAHHVIDFNDGVLSLPVVSIHDGTGKVFLNMMAFERLHGGARSDATAYMIFMDNIIGSESDVALLRSKGIIKNLLSSDQDAANLFNSLSKGAVLSPYSRLHDVRREVHDHIGKPWNKHHAIFRHAYLSNPWVFISLVAASVLLVATIMQTVYAVVQFYK